ARRLRRTTATRRRHRSGGDRGRQRRDGPRGGPLRLKDPLRGTQYRRRGPQARGRPRLRRDAGGCQSLRLRPARGGWPPGLRRRAGEARGGPAGAQEAPGGVRQPAARRRGPFVAGRVAAQEGDRGGCGRPDRARAYRRRVLRGEGGGRRAGERPLRLHEGGDRPGRPRRLRRRHAPQAPRDERGQGQRDGDGPPVAEGRHRGRERLPRRRARPR
ncbi:MAG: 3-isopropylmalate dehydrogenase, partial [uncultured Rubrobacteraceae bacterium]